jgi:hypothetical protein
VREHEPARRGDAGEVALVAPERTAALLERLLEVVERGLLADRGLQLVEQGLGVGGRGMQAGEEVRGGDATRGVEPSVLLLAAGFDAHAALRCDLSEQRFQAVQRDALGVGRADQLDAAGLLVADAHPGCDRRHEELLGERLADLRALGEHLEPVVVLHDLRRAGKLLHAPQGQPQPFDLESLRHGPADRGHVRAPLPLDARVGRDPGVRGRRRAQDLRAPRQQGLAIVDEQATPGLAAEQGQELDAIRPGHLLASEHRRREAVAEDAR